MKVTAKLRMLCQYGQMKRISTVLILLSLPLCLASGFAVADPVTIVSATARKDAAGWTFDVTLSHPDAGWEHYADAWEIVAPDGTSLGLRDLAHPHVEEQPFTRSLSGVTIPENMTHVMVRARCLVDGWSDETLRLDLPR